MGYIFEIPDFHDSSWRKIQDTFEDTQMRQGKQVVGVWRWGATYVYERIAEGVRIEGWETYWLSAMDADPFLKSWRPNGPHSLLRAVRLLDGWKVITGTKPHRYRVHHGPPRTIELLFYTGSGMVYRKTLVEDATLSQALHS